MTKRAALYIRVSTQEQVRHGYSFDGQERELRPKVEDLGREVVAVIKEGDFSRENIDRPGIDALLELAADGEIQEVWAWQWSRYGASPVPEMLQVAFAEYGVTLRALDDSGEGEDAEFLNGIKSLISKRELRATTRATRNGRLTKASKGKVVGTGPAPYGYRYNDSRDMLEIDEERIPTVRRIFADMAAGSSLNGLVNALNREDTPTPGGGALWKTSTVKEMLNSDVYRPHTRKELQAFVEEGFLGSEVLAAKDPERLYGICWYGRWRDRTVKRTVTLPNGTKKQRKRHVRTPEPRSEWIAVPVPDAGIPVEVVEAARAGIKDNRRSSKSGNRFWELSGGMARCGECGRAMSTHTITNSKRGTTYYYYFCNASYNRGGCSVRKMANAAKLERRIADFVTGLLADGGRLMEELDALIDNERAALRDPEPEARAWAVKLADLNKERDGYIRQNARGLISDDEADGRIQEVDDRRTEAEDGLRAAQSRQERVADLERDREAIKAASRRRALSGGLSEFSPEERRMLYQRLRLQIAVNADQGLMVDGDIPLAFGYLGSPLMLITEEMKTVEDEDGGPMAEGTLKILETAGSSRSTAGDTPPPGRTPRQALSA